MELIDNFIELLNRVSRVADYRSRIGIYDEKVYKFFKKYNIHDNKKICKSIDAKNIFNIEIKSNLSMFLFFIDEINAYGNTNNNIKEFIRLEKILYKKDRTIKIKNISNNLKVKKKSNLFVSKSDVLKFKNVFYEWVDSKGEHLYKYTIYECLRGAKAYWSWIYNNPKSICERVKLAIVANDHTPFQVAFFLAAKTKGIPTLYIQHAEITNLFSPLIFDFAILHNNKSLEKYKRIGKVLSKVFIIPKWDSNREFNEKSIQRKKNITVGIYLTESSKYKKINEIVNNLKSNYLIKEVFLKPHPRTKNENLFILSEIHCRVLPNNSDIKDFLPDVALVQNSSSVIELLHEGVKVFQLFGYDFIENDYYGFVKEKIVPEVSFEELKKNFWEVPFFDDNWEKRFSNYDPSLNISKESQTDKLYFSLKNFLDDRKKPSSIKYISTYWNYFNKKYGHLGFDSTKYNFLLYYIYKYPKMFLLTQTFTDVKDKRSNNKTIFDNYETIKFMEKIHDYRYPQMVILYKEVNRYPILSAVHFWLFLKSFEWFNKQITNYEIDIIFSFFGTRFFERRTQGKLENLILRTLLRFGRLNLILDFFNKTKFLSLKKLSINNRIGLRRIILESTEITSEIKNIEKELFLNLDSFNKYKLTILGIPLLSNFETNTHKKIINNFLNVVPLEIKKEFVKYALPTYNLIKNSNSFFDVQWSIEQKNKLLSKFEKAISLKKPFSFIRLSDGEGYIFYYNSVFFNSYDASNRERHWWGEELSKEKRKEICESIILSVKESNILGIPSVYRFLRDLNSKSLGLFQNLTGRGLLEVLFGIKDFHKIGNIYTEEKANIPLFKDINDVKKLIVHSTKTIIITSLKKQILDELLIINNKIEIITIPTHYRTQNNDNYTNLNFILPNFYNEVIKELNTKVEPGVLVLVSAGIIGKIFIGETKRLGGVGLDIGGIIDLWQSNNRIAW